MADTDDLILDEEDHEAPVPAASPAAAAASATSQGDDLVLGDDDEDDEEQQPVFQSGGGDGSMVAKEADKETASGAGLESSLPSTAAFAAAAAQREPGKPAAKAVLVGDSGVGKTSLLLRFSQVRIRRDPVATNGRTETAQPSWPHPCTRTADLRPLPRLRPRRNQSASSPVPGKQTHVVRLHLACAVLHGRMCTGTQGAPQSASIYTLAKLRWQAVPASACSSGTPLDKSSSRRSPRHISALRMQW